MKSLKILFLLLCSYNAISQTNDSLLRDFYFVKNTNAWLLSNNASGLHHFDYSHLATAQVSMKKNNGKFINYYQSDNSLQWNAKTESYFRLNKKVVFYGLLDYNNFIGKNMGGSVFINPNKIPFNIVEGTDTTQGTKSKENYRLAGAFNVEIIKNLYLGAKIDYNTAHYAKQRDLRHQNKLLQLNLTTGVSYNIKNIEIGLNYLYDKRIEEVQFKSFGNTDKLYMHLIDWGSFYGYNELYDKDNPGYISGRNPKPVFTIMQGLGCQIEMRFGKQFTFFNELGVKKIKGSYGIEETNNILFSVHDGCELFYKGFLQFAQKNNIHQLNLKFKSTSLNNNEKIFRSSTPPGELPKVEYMGKKEVLHREVTKVEFCYTAYLGTQQIKPKWELQAKLIAFNRNQKTSLFPFYRKQELTNYLANISLSRTFLFDKKYLSVTAKTGYGEGKGAPFTDEVLSSSFDENNRPKSSDFNLYKEYEFYTAKRIVSNLNIRYSFPLSHKNSAYSQINYDLTYAFDKPNFKANNLQVWKLSLGINF